LQVFQGPDLADVDPFTPEHPFVKGRPVVEVGQFLPEQMFLEKPDFLC